MSDFSFEMLQWPFDSPNELSMKKDYEKKLESTLSHEQNEQMANFIRSAQIQNSEVNESQNSFGKQVPKPLNQEGIKCSDRKVLKYAQYIGKEKNQKRSQKKNTNFVKFLIKLYFRCVKNFIPLNEEDHSWVLFNHKLKDQVFKKGVNNITRLSLHIVFSSDLEQNQELYGRNRNFLFNILRSPNFIHQNIIRNHYMKSMRNKIQHLLASKVFKLRCHSKTLVTRHETR